jgi:plasmid stabilization system protein ParE
MTHKVRILSRARQDVSACYDYIATRSLQGAADWFESFVASLDRLAQHPESLAIAAESENGFLRRICGLISVLKIASCVVSMGSGRC